MSVEGILSGFVDDLHDRIDDVQRFENILRGSSGITTEDVSSEPETWTEDILINPLLSHTDIEKLPGRPSTVKQTPDFHLKVADNFKIVGESKSINNINDAIDDLTSDYICNKSWSDYGIATDGIRWVIFKAEDIGESYEYPEVGRVDLRSDILKISNDKGYIDYDTTEDKDSEDFDSIFSVDGITKLLKQEAPKILRNKRKEDVDEFFDVYSRLVFGKDAETSRYLTNDIIPHNKASKKDIDVFAITLVNRLLFVRMLEDRGVIPTGFLEDRVSEYNNSIPISLYKSVISPLFYDLLNTEKDQRRDDLLSGWPTKVPFLNGGLFRPNIKNEYDYDVRNDTLKSVIKKLILGYELDVDINPKLLGSVFEKTINYISEEEDRQKDMGAFYTPDDITRLIVSQTVDEKAKEVLIDAFADEKRQPEEFKGANKERELSDILQDIEQGVNGWGSGLSAQKARLELKQLRILDPACGSGHFLTAALDELFQVHVSLLRSSTASEPSGKRLFQEKKEVALHCIYGVDIDRVATEIAKLRVWLSIIKEGWDEAYGRLPNIDFNISTGNSLIGLPISGSGQLTIEDAAIEDIISKRNKYKYRDEGDKSQISDDIQRMNDALNDKYLGRTTTKVEQKIESTDYLTALLSSIKTDDPSSVFESIQIKREDPKESVNEQDFSDIDGVDVHDKSARIYIGEWTDHKRANGNGDNMIDKLNECLDGLVKNRYVLSEVKRKVVPYDLSYIPGKPFHWPAQFPEALPSDNEECPKFDIVLGNPPYGNVLDSVEKSFLSSMSTHGMGEISMQFIERSMDLLKEGGIFGNIVSLKTVYQKRAKPARELIEDRLTGVDIACFARRPKKVFEDAEARSSIIVGNHKPNGNSEIRTSEFIRLHDKTREQQIDNITYERINGLVLGNKIGSGENYSWPKVGNQKIRSILERLRDKSSAGTIRDWRLDKDTGHKVWRRRGCSYWMDPMLQNLYDEGETPTSMHEMKFENELKRRFVFLVMQSTLYYLYWMVYKNERNIDWFEIDAFPVVNKNEIRKKEEDIKDLSKEVWDDMSSRFVGGMREIFKDSYKLKPKADKIDDLIDPLYGIDGDLLKYVKNYDYKQRVLSNK